jgi:hypothetical protein
LPWKLPSGAVTNVGDEASAGAAHAAMPSSSAAPSALRSDGRRRADGRSMQARLSASMGFPPEDLLLCRVACGEISRNANVHDYFSSLERR